ncbi:hypothetical protein AAC387_Pa03g1704 [Persea americana]
MKTLKGVGLTSKYLGISFGHPGTALTRCRKSSRVVPLQELAIDGQHTSITLHVQKSICAVGEDFVDDEGPSHFGSNLPLDLWAKTIGLFTARTKSPFLWARCLTFLSKDAAMRAW